MAYTKLFNSIVTSTIWTEDDQTRIVWITMLALADKNGEVQGSVPGLARIAGVPVEATRKALEKFQAPDPDSRTKDDQGRRIEPIEGGWALLNHSKYRKMASSQDAIEANAERQRRHQAKKRRNADITPTNAFITPPNGDITPEGGKAEADAEKQKQTQTADTNTEEADTAQKQTAEAEALPF